MHCGAVPQPHPIFPPVHIQDRMLLCCYSIGVIIRSAKAWIIALALDNHDYEGKSTSKVPENKTIMPSIED